MTTTRQSLGVFMDGEERPGLTFYAYWKGDRVCPSFPKQHWWCRRIRQGRLYGDGWTVCTWDVELMSWPAADVWPTLLAETLATFVEAGARVAWCGLEGFFADPPLLFDPSYMSGGVYAALAPEFDFRCSAPLDGPLQALSDDDLRNLAELV